MNIEHYPEFIPMNVIDFPTTSVSADSRLQQSYNFDYDEVSGSDRLIIIFSHSDEHAFRSQKFGCSCLRIVDRYQTYYTRDAGALARELLEIVDQERISEAVFLGASKGGYGAALLGSAVAARTSKPIYAVLFSPVLKIWPKDANLGFPSYLKLFSRAEVDPKIASNLERYGQLHPGFHRANLKVLFVAGRRNRKDMLQTQHLPKNAEILLLDLETHLSVIPFICDPRSPEDVERTVRRLYGAAKHDADIADLLGAKQAEALLSEMSKVENNQPLASLVAEFLSSGVKQHASSEARA